MADNRPSTSKSGTEKIRRALNQLERAEALLRSLPNYIYRKKKPEILKLTRQIEEVTEKTKTTLSEHIDDV